MSVSERARRLGSEAVSVLVDQPQCTTLHCRTTLPQCFPLPLAGMCTWWRAWHAASPGTRPPGLPQGLPRAHVLGLPRPATESVRTKSRGTLANACMCVCLAWVQEEDNRTLAESGVKKRGNPVVTVGLPVVLTSGFSFALLKFLNK